MSSLIRTIQRTVERDAEDVSIKSKRRHYAGRGSQLGTKNPKDACLPGVARKKPKVWRDPRKVDVKAKKPRQTLGAPARLSPRLTKADQREAHRDRMLEKARRRDANQRWASRSTRVIELLGTPASLNRNTGKPHKHAAERARRTRQASGI